MGGGSNVTMVSSPPNRRVTRLHPPHAGPTTSFLSATKTWKSPHLRNSRQPHSPPLLSIFLSFFFFFFFLAFNLLQHNTEERKKMKNLYSKSKGKIYPSPSSTSSPCPPPNNKCGLSVLNLLPTAILAMVMVMGSEDKEALAYMLLRSMKTPSLVLQEKRRCKKASPAAAHRPLLDCPCFECYTSFWNRWDSSPNRELIHQAIEAFEEHLAKGEKSSSSSSKKARKKDRRALEKAANTGSASPVRKGAAFGGDDAATSPELVGNVPAGKLAFEEDGKEGGEEKAMMLSSDKAAAAAEEDGTSAALGSAAAGHGRGPGRKVWPDMIGMFNSRLWGLWNPTV